MALVKEFEHLKISSKVIKLATNSFGSDHLIGVGGFGKVYKGEIPDSDGRPITVAIKRLDRKHGQGQHEFLTEIMLLSRHRHKNLVSLIGFCDEEGEKILVYEYAFNGSLEKYLNNETLTWAQRLRICIGAARGLEYLHDPLESQQRVLHRDVKSANVLLDQFWEAKIADFGLSKIGPANQEFTFLVSNPVGTLGYCDPLYAETWILTKESDVYSFGAVLFEVLCGRPCIVQKHDERFRLLTRLAQRSYEEKTLDHIIFNALLGKMEPYSLEVFSSIAYRCLRRDREERPTMAEVVADLELALEYQESYESGKPMEYEEILKMADREHPLVYSNKRELKLLLSSGILIDWGRRWFSLSKSENNCEMISASEFSFQDPELIEWITDPKSRLAHLLLTFQDPELIEWITDPKSRFSEVAKIVRAHDLNIDIEIETMFLSPGITYAAYLVFKYYDYSNYSYVIEDAEVASGPTLVGLRYKLKEADESSISYLADNVDDGWMIIELCQFVSYKKVAKLEVSLENFFTYNSILVEGIQFLPVEKAINDESIQIENIAHTLDTNREQKLPDDYRHIIKMAKDKVPYNITNQDLYLLLSNGVLTDKGQSFFYLDKDGLKCCMQSARSILKDNECFRSISIHQSRFENVAEYQLGNDFHINCHINYHMLSPNTTYATYLVYKLPELSHGMFECPLEVRISDRFYSEVNKVHFIFLTSPKTVVINLIKDDGNRDQGSQKNPLSRPKMEGIPKERKDGWMETEMWAFTTDVAVNTINREFALSLCDYGEQLTGLIVQGMEIRPK